MINLDREENKLALAFYLGTNPKQVSDLTINDYAEEMSKWNIKR